MEKTRNNNNNLFQFFLFEISAGLIDWLLLLLLLFFIMRFYNSMNKIFELSSQFFLSSGISTYGQRCFVYIGNSLGFLLRFFFVANHLICMQIINKMKIKREKNTLKNQKSNRIHSQAHISLCEWRMVSKRSTKTKRTFSHHHHSVPCLFYGLHQVL